MGAVKPCWIGAPDIPILQEGKNIAHSVGWPTNRETVLIERDDGSALDMLKHEIGYHVAGLAGFPWVVARRNDWNNADVNVGIDK